MTGERGSAAVEFALVLPVLLAVVGMVITGALAFTMNALVQRGAEYAARVAAVPTDLAPPSYATEEEIEQAAADGAILLTPTTVTRDCVPSPCRDGGRVSVTVTYDWSNPAAGFLNVLGGAAFGESFTFRATTRRVVE